jgi:hypothetical protein
MDMAVQHVREEGYIVLMLKVGRPQELSHFQEEAIVKCLCMCAEFQYPMRMRDLQLFEQDYVVENSIETRWEGGKPGKVDPILPEKMGTQSEG